MQKSKTKLHEMRQRRQVPHRVEETILSEHHPVPLAPNEDIWMGVEVEDNNPIVFFM